MPSPLPVDDVRLFHARFLALRAPGASDRIAGMAGAILYLYLNPKPRDRIQELTYAGIRRYAAAVGWDAIAWAEAAPDGLRAFLEAHRPVAGCIVECSDDNGSLPPRLFGPIPVVYLHASPALYGARAARVAIDNEAVARTAFRELAAVRPGSYAVVGDARLFWWSGARERAFRALATGAGAECRVFPHVADADLRAARLAAWVARLPPRTAVFAANDFAAADVVRAARAAGRAIPRDLALVGVDDNEAVCRSFSPAVSSIRLDFEREGYMAAQLVGKARLGRAAASEPVSVPPLMAVRRESTGGYGRRDPHVMQAVETIRREACAGLEAADVIARAPGSKSLFNLRFREATGHSVHDEIERVRLEKAFALLSQTGTAVGAVASLCGYRTNIALHKAFRLRTGMSMSAWRARFRT